MRLKTALATAAVLGCMLAPSFAYSVVAIPPISFTPAAGKISFNEPGFPLGMINPTYTPADYGGGMGAPTVTFGGYFMGQMLGGSSPPCPLGAALSGCVIGSPSGPLALDPTAPETFIANDGAMPTAPILSGSPLYNGPIAILFSTPQTAVGLIGGYFNAVGSTAITVYDANGNEIGSLANTVTGPEFLALATTDFQPHISGLLFHLVGAEPAGFDVDEIQFGVGNQIIPPGIPEPITLLLFGAGLAGLGLRRSKK